MFFCSFLFENIWLFFAFFPGANLRTRTACQKAGGVWQQVLDQLFLPKRCVLLTRETSLGNDVVTENLLLWILLLCFQNTRHTQIRCTLCLFEKLQQWNMKTHHWCCDSRTVFTLYTLVTIVFFNESTPLLPHKLTCWNSTTCCRSEKCFRVSTFLSESVKCLVKNLLRACQRAVFLSHVVV